MRSPLADIADGTVFLSAKWSGPSNMALRAIQNYWTDRGLDKTKLHILDWDKEEKELNQIPELSGFVHGYGEAFHIRDGKIYGFKSLGRTKNDLDSEITKFMEQ